MTGRIGGRIGIDAALVRRLVAARFPEWAGLPVSAVEPGGWDHRTFRLGDALSVRLPSALRYAAQVEKEQRWLPRFAPLLPLPIPVPAAMGEPAGGYPFHWSVYRWIDGDSADTAPIRDLVPIAADLADFLRALQRIGSAGGPPPGPHNFFRGGPLTVYDAETRDAIDALRDRIDADAATACWNAALAAPRRGPPVWVHGDVSAGNLLVRGGALCAVIDFGGLGVGDPACDLTIGWTLFSGESRKAFRDGMAADEATWTRARGWALWKALITLAGPARDDRRVAAEARRVADEVLAEYRNPRRKERS